MPGARAHRDPEAGGHQSMTPGQLLFSLFFFVLAAVAAAGYVFVLRPARAGESGEAAVPTALEQPDLPTAQAALVDVFRLIGEAVPGSKGQAAAARFDLIAAGYRWPSAVSIFLGIKCATALMLGVAGAWAAVTFRDSGADAILPAICGIG